MLPLSLHIQYEEKVIDLLKHQFSSEIDSNSKLLSHYYYKKKERVYEFDMVQLDEHNQKIKKVFEIKTKKILETNFNSIKNKLQQYKRATKAEVYLVYLENDAQFKSYKGKVQRYEGSGVLKYKYCYGKFATQAEAQRKLSELRRTFKGAFVVHFRDGKIVKD